MPRKTIAGLEAEIAALREELANERQEAADAQVALREERTKYAGQIFLSYVPSGSAEIDAMLVAVRALESLPSTEARVRCARWVIDRVTAEAGGQF